MTCTICILAPKYISTLSDNNNITVLSHHVNLGKGRALKTGFNEAINQVEKHRLCGVITADADGQHMVNDIIKIADCLVANNNSIIFTSVF